MYKNFSVLQNLAGSEKTFRGIMLPADFQGAGGRFPLPRAKISAEKSPAGRLRFSISPERMGGTDLFFPKTEDVFPQRVVFNISRQRF
ncbi:MAG: hypothetical protein IJY00_04295 [Bacteroidaceae bacterium]|nr:hypothetical protein [Bacteroidaceae bacterium]